MLFIREADIGVGEFYVDPRVVWGDTGWVVLASGIPVLQSFYFTAVEFHNIFGYSAAPILDVKSAEYGARCLEFMSTHAEVCGTKGKKSLAWFNQYDGIGLSRQSLDLLKE